MPAIRGITISVGYAFTLGITLVRNMRHLAECVVVTSPEDTATQEVASKVPGVRVLVSDAGTRHGARFNKGLLMEAGLDFLGRDGKILIHDADILLPDVVPFDQFREGCLHGCRRRILEDPRRWRADLDWSACPPARDGGPIGYAQLFDASDTALRDRRPWYDVSFGHAGGGDAAFMRHWPPSKYVMLPMDVLHLGPRDTNWFGADQDGRDMMAAFIVRNGWTRRNPQVDRAAAARVNPADIVHRVEVPGYEPSQFELPFVQRSNDRRG